MDSTEAVIYLAQSNGKNFVPLREDELEDVRVPYFQVLKDVNGVCGYSINKFNYKNHDNAPRMDYYCNYLLNKVFPNVNRGCDISGYYPIELHDSYTYLCNNKDYNNVLVFSKFKKDVDPVLLPDPFMIGNYGGRMDLQDPYKWNAKPLNKVGFYGVTTGHTDPLKNQRLTVSKWGLDNESFCDFYITRVVQMDVADVVKAYPRFAEMSRPFTSQENQYKYRFLMSIDGNTCSYDRMCWIMKSNSLLFKYASDEYLWYYPLVHEGVHYIGVNMDNMKSKYEFCLQNPEYCRFVINNAQKFTSTFATPISTLLYTTYLFETFAENK